MSQWKVRRPSKAVPPGQEGDDEKPLSVASKMNPVPPKERKKKEKPVRSKEKEKTIKNEELDAPLTISVGQESFTTTRRILTKYPDSVFSAWFSGRWDEPKKYEPRIQSYDPAIFGYIIEWLETDNMQVAELPVATVEILFEEAEYFLLEDLAVYVHQKYHRPELSRPIIKYLLSREPPVLNLENCSLFGLGLHVINFSTEEDLRDIKFNGSDLHNTDFTESSLYKADFTDANLTSTILAKAKLNFSIFNRTILDGTNFEGASFPDAVISNLSFSGRILKQITFVNTTFDNVSFADATLQRCTLVKINFDKCDITNLSFQECDFEECEFAGRDLSKNTFTSCRFMGCNFHKCRIGSGFVGCLSFRNCNLDEADLSECQLGNRTFNGSTMKFANIRGTNLESASFADVVAVGIKIDDKTNLERAVLTDADFSEVNFSGISLFGCKFDHAFLIDSDLSNCRTNSETTFVECTLANTKMNNSKFLLKKPAKVIACQFQEANLQYSEFERIVKWDGVTFEKSNLSNCTFIECGDLTNVNFKETTMDGARFTHSNLSNHQFISQSLARVEFLSVNLSNTRFDHCNLIRAVFTDTNMNSSHFIECAMDFITLDKNTKTFMERIKFISCKMANLDLRGGVLLGSELVGCGLASCDLSGANLRESNLKASIFDNAKLVKADLYHANLTGCSFAACSMDGAKLNRVKGKSASFLNAVMTNCDLERSNFSKSSFQFANMLGSNFISTIFDECNLQCAVFIPLKEAKLRKKRKKRDYLIKLTGSSFKNANMKGIDLRFADCRGASFKGADLTNALLTDSDIDTTGAITTRALF